VSSPHAHTPSTQKSSPRGSRPSLITTSRGAPSVVSRTCSFFLMPRPRSRSPLFPYTTLFRSSATPEGRVLHRADARHPLAQQTRSEEHTSELQSLAYLVCRLLLEKKKTSTATHTRPSSPDLRSSRATMPCTLRSRPTDSSTTP